MNATSACPRLRFTGWSPERRNVFPCKCFQRSATSSAAPGRSGRYHRRERWGQPHRHRRPARPGSGERRETAAAGGPDSARRMSPAYCTDEQFERWFKKPCARCGRHGFFGATWPDGKVCRTCHDQALRIRGRCPGCGVERVLPGVHTADRTPICADSLSPTTALATGTKASSTVDICARAAPSPTNSPICSATIPAASEPNSPHSPRTC